MYTMSMSHATGMLRTYNRLDTAAMDLMTTAESIAERFRQIERGEIERQKAIGQKCVCAHTLWVHPAHRCTQCSCVTFSPVRPA
jgi:hypothetical protein